MPRNVDAKKTFMDYLTLGTTPTTYTTDDRYHRGYGPPPVGGAICRSVMPVEHIAQLSQALM